ncbi:hypothetical protein YA0002_15865 [Pseudomonas cichorii]|uniref:hypothetical protein n=1 Tax=Pseudomonas cichorii TaxID=36746 RepID=UPI0018E5ABFE|nr:hypothetical protein [Pseudomonas cichorii]MBI6854255.1 hypothetical protein [Pseudomonas cichorii]
MRGSILALGCLALGGCSWLGINKEPAWPWPEGEVCTTAGKPVTCEQQHVLKAYNLALKYCIDYSNMYENGTDTLSGGNFAISAVGTLSGAVIAPLAGGSAKDAWAGLSGATNALQGSLNESFSKAVNTRRRLEINNAGASTKLQVVKSSTAEEKVLAAVDIAYDCRMAAARADGAALQALNTLQAGTAAVSASKIAAEVDPSATAAKAAIQATNVADSAAKKNAATTAALVTPGNATAEERSKIIEAQAALSTVASTAAGNAAGQAATDTAQMATSASSVAPNTLQTEISAKAAAQVVAGTAAQAAVDAKVQELSKNATPLVREVIRQMAAPTAKAAASAAAGSAASTATAPVQILDGL